MVRFGRRVIAIVALTLTLALAGCGEDAAPPVPSPSADASTTATGLSAIACATDDPTDVGELTGAWSGNDGGTYYLRQVGDCVWWFGTELKDIESGLTGQPGFSNVASGRVDGTHVEVEWADLPAGDTLGGGGLTLLYVEEDDQLLITEQRGEWVVPYGATVLTRIEPNESPDASPSASASP